MLPFDPFLHDFEGSPLLTLTREGRPFWLARHVGTHLGLGATGEKLPHLVLGEWAHDFAHGHDFAFVQGRELDDLRRVLSACGQPVGSTPRGLLVVLYETGLVLALSKLEMDRAARLRSFVMDTVLPDLAHVRRRPSPRRQRPRPLTEEARPARQRASLARVIDLNDRLFQVTSLRHLIRVLGDDLDRTSRGALEIVAAEIATGIDLSPLLHPAHGLGRRLDEADLSSDDDFDNGAA